MTTQSDIKKLAEHMAGSMRSSDTVLISKHQTHNLGLDNKILSSIDTALRLMLRTTISQTFAYPCSYAKGQTTTEIVVAIKYCSSKTVVAATLKRYQFSFKS